MTGFLGLVAAVGCQPQALSPYASVIPPRLPVTKELTVPADDAPSAEDVSFRPNHPTQLAGAYSDGTLRIWDYVSGKIVRQLHYGSRAYRIAFSPDGERLACGGGTGSSSPPAPASVKIWDVSTGRKILELPHAGFITGVAYSHDGRMIASGCVQADNVQIWDASTSRRLYVFNQFAAGADVRFSPDDRYVFTNGGWIWQLPASFGIGRAHEFPQLCFGSTAISPDQKLFFGGYGWTPAFLGPGRPGRICVSDFPSGKHQVEWALDKYGISDVLSLAVSPHNRELLSADGWRLRLWSLDGRPLFDLTSNQRANLVQVAFSPDGKMIAASDERSGSIFLWENPGSR
jgi:WD40 repeat protein